MSRRISPHRDSVIRAVARGALPEDVADEFGLHPGTVREWVREGPLSVSDRDDPTALETIALYRLMRGGARLPMAARYLRIGLVRAENCLGKIYLAMGRIQSRNEIPNGGTLPPANRVRPRA